MAFILLLAISIVPFLVGSVIVFQLGIHKGTNAVRIWLGLCLLPWAVTAIWSHHILRNPDGHSFEFALLATIASSFPFFGCMPGLFWLDCVHPCQPKPLPGPKRGFSPSNGQAA